MPNPTMPIQIRKDTNKEFKKEFVDGFSKKFNRGSYFGELQDFIADIEHKAQKRGAEEIVICAAVKATNGRIFRGHRHQNCILAIRDALLKVSTSNSAQGFITSKNRFVTREQGRILQDKAGIESVAREGYMGQTLFSEDLY